MCMYIIWYKYDDIYKLTRTYHVKVHEDQQADELNDVPGRRGRGRPGVFPCTPRISGRPPPSPGSSGPKVIIENI